MQLISSYLLGFTFSFTALLMFYVAAMQKEVINNSFSSLFCNIDI
jgi:hypothetical protein